MNPCVDALKFSGKTSYILCICSKYVYSVAKKTVALNGYSMLTLVVEVNGYS